MSVSVSFVIADTERYVHARVNVIYESECYCNVIF